jgi:hypothetical protein
MPSVLFSGCSLVEGFGFPQRKEDPGLFCNLFTYKLFGSNAKLDNIAIAGNSNDRIFLESAEKLIQNTYDYAFISWTALHRYIFWDRFELYDTRRFININTKDCASNLKKSIQTNLSSDYSKHETVFSSLLNHSHYYIRDLVNYVNILKNLAKAKKTKLFFINSILPWDSGYFNRIDKALIPAMLTNYTKEILDFHHRTDDDIKLLYQVMHDEYINIGGIQEDHWLNLYQSYYSMIIDFSEDGIHPGYQTNKLFADFLITQFEQNKYYHGI